MITSRLGKYEIKRWLGGGQFGDVYLANDTILGTDFALKVSRMREDEIVMLKDEARLLSSLNHKNIVRFFNIDVIEGKFVLVIEYIDGSGLRELIRKDRRLDNERAASLTRQILAGLEYAHSHRVIHRDLKPENILIDTSGTVKLSDFGLARFIRPGSISASAAGTPLYMAPEAWAGHFSEASDIWSVTTILYEMLTGQPPFLADNLEALREKIVNAEYLAVSTLVPGIPRSVEHLIEMGLSPDAKNRPSVNEFIEVLSAGKTGVTLTKITPAAVVTSTIPTPTPGQQAVINDLAGPIVVFGAPGAGKTTTLGFAVAKKIEDGLSPDNILVLTFTNKAANDIRDRLKKMLDASVGLEDLWLGTFHFQALKILRRWAERLDFDPDFMVLPVDEINLLLKAHQPPVKKIRAILHMLSTFKSYGKFPDEIKAGSEWEKTCLDFYKTYAEVCRKENVMDYDDLILYTIKLLAENPDIREYYASKFQSIFVDELQDTNIAQYELLRCWASAHHNILFTGDEDQAIYGWRGAKKELMYHVYKTFPPIRTFVLNKSFRVPERIAELSQNLILRNKDFKEHVIPISTDDQGEVIVYAASNVEDEAGYVSKEIEKLANKEDRPYSDFAVLYRRHAQSRPFEELFSRKNIPYSLIGAERFYQREEVKMFTDYLSAVAGANEQLGVRTISQILGLEKVQENKSGASNETGGFKAAHGKLRLLGKCVEIFKSQVKEKDLLYPVQMLDAIIIASGSVRKKTARAENIRELMQVAKGFGRGELTALIEHIRLIEDLDLLDWSKDSVKLLTIHAAKGLEFPLVFLTGLVEGQFPMLRFLNDPKEIEEERRLCYVAITRVSKKLYLTYPKVYYGRHQSPSRFIIDMLGR